MRRLAEIVRSGKDPEGSEWHSVTHKPKPTVFDRMPAYVELLGCGVLLGLPALAYRM